MTTIKCPDCDREYNPTLRNKDCPHTVRLLTPEAMRKAVTEERGGPPPPPSSVLDPWNANRYQKLALRTMADQAKVRERFNSNPNTMQMYNAFVGLSNDVGELGDVLKDAIEYGKPFDRPNAIEEIGDILWRVAQFCDAIGTTVGECMAANIRKLAVRYPDKYSDERAANRDRDAEAKAMDEGLTAEGVDNCGQRWAD